MAGGSADRRLGRLDLRRAQVVARARARQGARRVRTALVPVLWASAGASLAWVIAHQLLGHPMPIFAPLATWICLGFTANRAPRAVAEMGLGATVGVGIGELFAVSLGSGWWQIGLALLTAALAGRFLDRGMTFTFQVVGNGVVIVGMASFPVPGGAGGRWVDALVGALVAFVIAVVLPGSVEERPRRYARSVLAELAVALEMLAAALRSRDMQRLLDVPSQLDAVREGVDDLEAALKAAQEVAALNPRLRGELPRLDELDRIAKLARRAEISLAMLSRQAIGFSEQAGSIPIVGDRIATAATAARSLAAAVGGWHRPERARELLTEAARGSAPTSIESTDWRPAALMADLRALLVDLLQMTGLSRDAANSLLAGTLGGKYALPDARPPEDGASALWG